MKNVALALLVSVASVGAATAQTLEVVALGALELAYERPVAVSSYPGQPLSGRVGFRSGEAYSVPSPGRVQQIEYLVEPGAAVSKGQPFAVLRGPEMHHFEMSYHSSRALAAGAEQRFKSNQPLYERKAISESQWRQISENYYASQLEYEHMRHFFELVAGDDNDPAALTLTAPLTGVIDYDADGSEVGEGDSIALFIPRAAIRLQVALPQATAAAVFAVRAGSCELQIERVSAMTDSFFIRAWTQTLPPACPLLLGQQLLLQPLLRVDNAYRVARAAVFALQRQTYVWRLRDDTLEAVPVTVLAAEGDAYIVHSEEGLAGQSVLVSSVSAVQGVLLGLGGE